MITSMNRSFKNIFFRIVKIIFFISIFLTPIIIMYFQSKNAPLVGHDFFILYGRKFLNPEHGRYIATWLGHIFIERLPVLLNIHVSDLNVSVILGLKIFINTIIFSLISFGFLMFFDKKDKGDVWIWLLGYLASFFILFNNNFFFFSIWELTSFLEYVASLIPYLIFLLGIFYFYTKEKIPTKPVFILILSAIFFSGITVELLNIPSFIFISLITLFVLIDYLKSDKTDVLKKQRLNFFLCVFFVHLFSLFLYYINPADNQFSDNHLFFSHLKSHLSSVWDFLVVKLLPFHILNIIGLFLIFLLKKNQKEQNVRFVSSVLLINLSFLFFYIAVLYFIFCFAGIDYNDYFGDEKNFSPYVVVLLLNNFMILGYLISSYASLSAKKIYILKMSAIVLSLLLIDRGFFENHEMVQNLCIDCTQSVYRIEKTIVKQRGRETIIIPAKGFEVFDNLTRSYFSTLTVLYYPDFQNVKTVITDSNLEPDELTEDENKHLRFSDLLPHKINKYEGEYGMLDRFEKEKEEGSRVYFKKMK